MPLGGHLQAAQAAGIGFLARPSQDRGETASGQQLLARPGSLLPGFHHQETAQIDAGSLPGRGVGKERRRHQGDPAAGLGQAGQGRLEQGQFANAAFLHEEFGQFPLGPAAPRQFSIQFRVAAGDPFPGQAG